MYKTAKVLLVEEGSGKSNRVMPVIPLKTTSQPPASNESYALASPSTLTWGNVGGIAVTVLGSQDLVLAVMIWKICGGFS